MPADSECQKKGCPFSARCLTCPERAARLQQFNSGQRLQVLPWPVPLDTHKGRELAVTDMFATADGLGSSRSLEIEVKLTQYGLTEKRGSWWCCGVPLIKVIRADILRIEVKLLNAVAQDDAFKRLPRPSAAGVIVIEPNELGDLWRVLDYSVKWLSQAQNQRAAKR